MLAKRKDFRIWDPNRSNQYIVRLPIKLKQFAALFKHLLPNPKTCGKGEIGPRRIMLLGGLYCPQSCNFLAF